MEKLNVLFSISLILVSCTSKNQKENRNMYSNSQDNEYLIAYNVYVPDSISDDNYEIFTMKLDGSDKKNITNHPDVAWTYLANKNKVFFISDRDTTNRVVFLYEMDYDGSNIKKITDFQLSDSWMGSRKNGEELIVSPHPKVDSVLYIINRKGDILHKIVTGTPYASDPTFSPDGDKIAFIGKNKKSKREPGFKAEIYVVNSDGTGLTQLTSYPESDTTAEWYAYKAGPPKWHPTENFITYQSKQNGKYSLYAVSPDGKKQWKLTENKYEEGWHDWSPDGNWLAIELFDSEQTQFHIGLINWKTKELKILTDTSYKYQQAPVFLEI